MASAANLSAEIWALVGVIAGLTVVMCLAVLASLHGYLMRVRKLSDDVQRLRQAYSAAFGSAKLPEGVMAGPPQGSADDDEDAFMVV